MDGYLGEFTVKLKGSPFAEWTPSDWTLYFRDDGNESTPP